MEDKQSTPAPTRDRASAARELPRQATSLRFGSVAAVLAQVATAEGLVCPAFRSPPGLVGVSRSVRRRGSQVTVAVALRGRPWAAVLADMVEGVVVTNRLRGLRADRCRARLWEGLGAAGEIGAEPAAEAGHQARDRRMEQNRKNGEKAPGFAA